MTESKTYRTMLQEVETILQDMSRPDLDLDQMVTKVERGYELIQSMRGRLEQTKGKIEDLHKRFDESMKAQD